MTAPPPPPISVLDASAVLAWLQDEPGADVVDTVIAGAMISAANLSEVAQKTWQAGRDGDRAARGLTDVGLLVQPVAAAEALMAARLWRNLPHLSLADRLCLALGRRTGATVWTADREWVGRAPGIDVRAIR